MAISQTDYPVHSTFSQKVWFPGRCIKWQYFELEHIQ